MKKYILMHCLNCQKARERRGRKGGGRETGKGKRRQRKKQIKNELKPERLQVNY